MYVFDVGLSESNINYYLVCNERCYPNMFTEEYTRFTMEYPDTVVDSFNKISQYVSQPGYPEQIESVNVQVRKINLIELLQLY